MRAHEVVCRSGRAPHDSGVSLSHDEFLGGRFQDFVRSHLGEDVLRQVLVVFHQMKSAVPPPVCSCLSAGSPLSEEDIAVTSRPLSTQPPAVGLRGRFYSDARRHQGLQWRLHRGGILQMALFDADHLLLVREAGASMYSSRSSELLWGIDSAVSCAAVDPDGVQLALGSADTVVLWDLHSGEVAKRLDAPGAAVTGIVFSPCRRYAATASLDTNVRIWDVATGEQVVVLESVFGVTSVQFHPHGTLLLTIGEDRNLHVWKWDHELGELHRKTWLSAVDPRGRLVAVSTSDKVHVHDLASGQLVHRFPHAPRSSLAFSPCGSFLATAHGDLTVWNVTSGKPLFQIQSAGGPLCFSPDGQHLAVGTGASVLVLSVPDGNRISQLECPPTGPVNAISYEPQGASLAVAKNDH